MAIVTYNKLVRDRIPDIMTEKSKAFEVRKLRDNRELERALLKKLHEEATEVTSAHSRAELVKELADLSEVVIALQSLKGISSFEVEMTRQQRQAERGGFENKVFLIWGESD